jgi:hypothetical protein
VADAVGINQWYAGCIHGFFPDSHGYQFYRKQYMEQKSSLIFQDFWNSSNIQWAMASMEFQNDHRYGYVVPLIFARPKLEVKKETVEISDRKI